MRNNLDHEINPQKHIGLIDTDNQPLTNKMQDRVLI